MTQLIPKRFHAISHTIDRAWILKLRQSAFLLITLIVSTQAARAANHYILPSGSGAKTGADWADSCAGFTGNCAVSSLLRGDTYYVAGGSYSALTLDTADSGSSTITIKGATAADHGTATGWSASFGVDATQATFAYPMNIYTSNWTLDGNTGSGTNGSSYGFTIGSAPCSSVADVNLGAGGGTVANVTLSHFYLNGCTADTETVAIYQGTTTTLDNFSLTYSYLNNWQVALYTLDPAGLTVDHNFITNGQSYSDHHGNLIDLQNSATGLTVSNNVISGCAGTVCMGANDTGGTCSGGVSGEIYGNVFVTGSSVGNGIIGATTRCYFRNTSVYNNTFTGTTTSLPWFQGCVDGAATCSSATGNVAENNIVWDASCVLGGGVGTDDYNTYLSCIDTPPSETHRQIGSFNPFVNTSAGNYLLANPAVSSCSDTSATCGGIALSSVFSLDPIGASRELGGFWARGAYQYKSSSGPGAPTNLTGQLQAQ